MLFRSNRELTVEPHIVGEVPPGYEIERVVLHPDKVVIHGPRSKLESQTTIHSLPIDVNGRQTSFRERVELTMDALLDVPANRRWVEVDVRIREKAK